MSEQKLAGNGKSYGTFTLPLPSVPPKPEAAEAETSSELFRNLFRFPVFTFVVPTLFTGSLYLVFACLGQDLCSEASLSAERYVDLRWLWVRVPEKFRNLDTEASLATQVNTTIQ